MSKDKKDRRWDGRSRVSTKQYKKNYDDIFKKEQGTYNPQKTEGDPYYKGTPTGKVEVYNSLIICSTCKVFE